MKLLSTTLKLISRHPTNFTMYNTVKKVAAINMTHIFELKGFNSWTSRHVKSVKTRLPTRTLKSAAIHQCDIFVSLMDRNKRGKYKFEALIFVCCEVEFAIVFTTWENIAEIINWDICGFVKTKNRIQGVLVKA